MNKKAISETLVILLIFVVGAIILLFFGSALAGQLKENADIDTCRLSVLAQAQSRKIPGTDTSTPGTLIPLDCPRRILKIFEDKVNINGKNSKKYEFKKQTEDELNHILAEELRLCWYKMAEGNRDIFEHSGLVGFDKTCLICSEIEFDDKSRGKSFGGLLDYLKSREVPKGNISYFDYLVRSQRTYYGWIGEVPWIQYSPFGYGTTERFSEDKVDTSQKYIIYFLVHKPNWLGQFTKMYTIAYYIGIGKEDKLKEECNTLVN